MRRDIYTLGKETYAIYTGQSTPAFAPLMAGITHPSPEYEIRSDCGGSYVFEYVLRGAGQVTQDGETVAVRAGDAYLLRAGRSRHYFPDAKDPWEKIWFNVNGSLVRHLLSDYGLDGVLKVEGFQNPAFLTGIFHALEADPAHCANRLQLLLHEHIQALSDFLGRQSASSSASLTMRNCIEQNLARPLSIDEIAASAHLSRSRALHLFREVYGVTPYRYYLSQKLELAQSMLSATSLSVQEISDRLGFADYHHFSAFFKKECGVSPQKYRQSTIN